MDSKNERKMSHSVLGSGAPAAQPDSGERRRHTRYPFTGTFEGFELNSQTRVQGRTGDLSEGGCYVDTMSPFPAGMQVKVRISKEKRSFEAHATVIYSAVGMGMGLRFDGIEPHQRVILKNWLAAARGEVVVEVEAEQAHAAPTLTAERESVLNQLIAELMRKGILNDATGREMLQKLL